MSDATYSSPAAVLGAGVAGLAVAELLVRHGVSVTVYDQAPAEQLATAAARLGELGVPLRCDGDVAGLETAALIVPSPGASVGNPLIEAAQARGQCVLAEIDCAQRALRSPLLAVTGTNGKTTTVIWAAHCLEAAGKPARVAGNTLAGGYQAPLASAALETPPDAWVVAEISSFQLELAREFRPRIAVITNVTPDHIDRHGTMEAYAAAKRRLIAAQHPGDAAILNNDDPLSREWGSCTRADVYRVSMGAPPLPGAGVEEGRLVLRTAHGREGLCAAGELSIPGAHTVTNALMAALAARLAGAPAGAIVAALRDFRGVPDRLERVAEIDGVEYVNNSMCTNVAAAVRSIEAYDRPVVVIAGGEDKGSDFAPLGRTIQQRARALVTIGRDGDCIAESARAAGFAAIFSANSMDAAVRAAAGTAHPGDVVLLAPACASFDWFRSFQHRGEVFRDCVRALAAERAR